jgi:hypothetical protein
MPKLTAAQKSEILNYVSWYEGAFNVRFFNLLGSKIRFFEETEEIKEVHRALESLRELMTSPGNTDYRHKASMFPTLKKVLLAVRREKADEIEAAKKTTIHPELLNRYEAT